MELDCSSDESKEGVVLAASAVCTRMDLGSPLADDDLACLHDLTAESLYAKALRVGIASVAG